LKLKRLGLHKLPGFDVYFEIANICDGINIIVGPNASGKTSICHAVRRLLWGGPSDFHHIRSEWLEEQDSFVIELTSKETIVTESGRTVFSKISAEKHLASCFNITIDELFNSNDKELSQKLSQEISGGYDVESVLKIFLKENYKPKKIVDEWDKSNKDLKKHNLTQHALRKEIANLPILESEIAKAKEARVHVQILDEIIKLKDLDLQIIRQQNTLDQLPTQLHLKKIEATDWKDYESLSDKKSNLKKELSLLENDLKKHAVCVEISEECPLPKEEEIRCLEHLLSKIPHLNNITKNAQVVVDKARQSVEEHKRLLGITSDEAIFSINPTNLDDLEEQWQHLDRLDSAIAGIETQIRVHDTVQNLNSDIYEQGANLLSSITTYHFFSFKKILIFTGMEIALFVFLLFFVPKIQLLVPISILSMIRIGWFWTNCWKVNLERQRLKEAYRQLETLNPVPDWSLTSIRIQLKRIVKSWGYARYVESQLQRKTDLEKELHSKHLEKKRLYQALIEQALKAGIGQLPNSRYQFINEIKRLHRDWISYNEAKIDLSKAFIDLKIKRKEWDAIVVRFEKITDLDCQELRTVYERIKSIREKFRIKDEIDETKRKLANTESAIQQLRNKTDCAPDFSDLKSLVEQLNHYNQQSMALENLKRQFFTIQAQLQEQFHQKISDIEIQMSHNIESLMAEKEAAEKMHKELITLSEKRGSLMARIDSKEAKNKGEELLQKQVEATEKAQKHCQNFIQSEFIHYLVSEARQDFQKDLQPAVLKTASSWFQKFTKDQFKLKHSFTSNSEITYEAQETAMIGIKNIDQMSRATRMQLLMSIRLAFAFHNSTVRLPIFLDETLVNADPERFHAIAKVLIDLATDGWQVFYLTSNSEDKTKWISMYPEVNLIDLAKIRSL